MGTVFKKTAIKRLPVGHPSRHHQSQEAGQHGVEEHGGGEVVAVVEEFEKAVEAVGNRREGG
jgi:hypothetical protein